MALVVHRSTGRLVSGADPLLDQFIGERGFLEQLAISLTRKWELAQEAKWRHDYLHSLVDLRSKKLQEANARLEQDVAARTMELSNRNEQLQQINEQLRRFVEELRHAKDTTDSTHSA